MKKLKLLLLLPMVFVHTACASNQAAQDYYAAVKASQDAQTMIAAARYQALAQMAQSGDPGAATAATMAIALSQTPTITPQYIESGALKWAQVLTPAVTTVGMGALSAWTSVNASNNSKDVQLASFQTNEAIQLGQQNMVANLGGQWAGAAAAGGQASAEIALAGFNALNTAGGQTADVAVAGFSANTDIATAGFSANTNIAGLGFATADSIATTGFDTVNDVAATGVSGIVLTAANGLTTANNIATTGFDTVNDVASTGMTNMTTIAQWGMEGMFAINQDTNATMAGIIADNNATSLANNTLTNTNYAQILADMNATIQQLGADLADPITCSPNADGLFVCQ